MKPTLLFVSCGTAAAVIVCLLAVVHTRGQSETPVQTTATPNNPVGPATDPTSTLVPYRIDTNTWQITTPDGVPVEGTVNSPDAVEYRRLANMAAVDPAGYAQLYPKTAAELAASEAAREEIENPKSLEQRLAEITDPAELAKWTAAIDMIMHPIPMTEEMIEAAIRNDPKGPWAMVFKKP
jgi:hypothetical protein